MVFPEYCVTERLKGDRPTPSDFADYCLLFQDARVTETLTLDGQPLPLDQIQARFKTHLKRWEKLGFGVWMFREQATNQFVGYCGFRIYLLNETEIELMYALITDAWGKGYATEMAKACVQLGFERLEYDSIVGLTLERNQASQHVLEKAGLMYEAHKQYRGLPHMAYRLTRDAWKNRQHPIN
ncbi:MAG TPA: GNAT family N-acetyltransferase [Leptolyngbyaceae cyanobacterium M33_DOE_097]|nr:GNAT family N-acetyltransferase [Leptolyngbyaceae cyanobacterium M33_DOE_097]